MKNGNLYGGMTGGMPAPKGSDPGVVRGTPIGGKGPNGGTAAESKPGSHTGAKG